MAPTIRAIQALPIRPPGGSRPYLWVKLETDDPEIYGLGEATLRVKNPAVAAAIELIASRIEGMSVFNAEELFYKYFYHDRWRGGVIMNTAIAAIEMAMYDAAARSLGVPVYNLFGGRLRNRIPLYAHGWGGIPRRVRETGFRAFKTDPIPMSDAPAPLKNEVPRGGVEAALQALQSAREEAGPEVELFVECHGRFTYDEALHFVREAEQFRPGFIEEPVQPDDIDSFKKLALRASVPIAGGERLFTRFGYRRTFEAGVLSIAQPDFTHCAGLLEAKKLAALAELYYVRLAPHNSSGPIATVASAHVDATLTNFYMQEYIETEMFEQFFVVHPRIEAGCLVLEEEQPGLGLVPDWDALARHRTELAEGTTDW